MQQCTFNEFETMEMILLSKKEVRTEEDVPENRTITLH